MPHHPLGKWLEENQQLFINGYFAQRIANGQFPPDNREPRASLPVVPAEASMSVEIGFLVAYRAEEQKKRAKKTAEEMKSA